MAAGLDALQVLGTALGAEDDGIPGGLEDVDHIWIIYPKNGNFVIHLTNSYLFRGVENPSTR